MKAYCLLRDALHYRKSAFIAGLYAAGYQYFPDTNPQKIEPGDVLVIWNRYGTFEDIADRFEARGGTVVVAENGYMGRDQRGEKMFALAVHGHNGSGSWNRGGPERFAALGIELKPWRETGRHILIAPNRTFGMRGFRMAADWAATTAHAIRLISPRMMRVRKHPGNQGKMVMEGLGSLEYDLLNAWCCVIWSSSAGLKALQAGIPVIQLAPHWVAAPAAGHLIADIETPPMPDRQQVFEDVAWAQWSLDEIRSGEAFRFLLTRTTIEAGAAA